MEGIISISPPIFEEVRMPIQTIDNVSFQMKEVCDFSFLSKYGRVFCVFDQNDSGNISFGVDNGKEKKFIKIAGAKTANSCISSQKAVENLKIATSVYNDLAHPHLIQLIEHFSYKDLYIAVFKWVDGECLFDYWNFEKYSNNSELIAPRERFIKMPCDKKLNAFNTVFEFLTFIESKNYVAVDFYDGSIMYDFENDIVTVCDVDFFRKNPLLNDIGEDFWGTKRLKSPEEYTIGEKIDTITNVFTLGALLFHFFGSYTDEEIARMYEKNAFIPCRYETWELSENLYKVALKAVQSNRENRYSSMKSFYEAWKDNIS